MGNSNEANSGGNGSDVRRANPNDAAVDPAAAAQQAQVKADSQAIRESARRVESSVPANGEAVTDPDAAAIQEQVKADHDRLQESARRVDSSVPEEVRNTPVQRANDDDAGASHGADAAHENAEAAREGARRINESAPKR